MRILKAVMILAVLASTLTLGACQNKTATTTTSGKESGYHK